jgi:anti-sigma B factor antagonist
MAAVTVTDLGFLPGSRRTGRAGGRTRADPGSLPAGGASQTSQRPSSPADDDAVDPMRGDTLRHMSDTGVRLEIVDTPSGLDLRGEIDAHTAPELAAHLDPLPGDHGDVVLGVNGIEFIDSSGLRVLIDAHQRAGAAGRRLVIAKPSAAVRRLFEISGLLDHLVVED